MKNVNSAPNIVYFHTHDTGRYLQPYGYAVPTPHVQRLAEEGVLFRKAFCAAPTCSPSRAALFTGCAPHSVGMLGLAHLGYALNDYSKTLISVLNRAGYVTVLCGGQHIAPHERIPEIGYAEVPVTEFNPKAHEAAAHACAFIARHEVDGPPFFLDVGAFETHRQGTAGPSGEAAYHPESPQGDGRYVRPPEPIPDTPETRADWADFHEAARRADRAVGSIYEALKAKGIRDDTLFVVTTDHGPPLPGMKCTLSDAGLQVALILRGPGGFRGGRVIDGMVSQIDLLPTLCDWLGLPVPGWVQGRSFLPMLAPGDGEADGRAEVFGEITYHGKNVYNPQRCIRTERYKLIRRFTEDTACIPATCDNSPTKRLYLEMGWEGLSHDAVQLYDLTLDPNEGRNLANEAGYAGIRRELESRQEAWMRETGDSLLGEVG